MRFASRAAGAVVLSVAALARADTVLTFKTHADGFEIAGQKQGPVDGRYAIWLAGAKARHESGDIVFVVRRDLKKAYLVNRAARTFSEFDLPLDPAKMLPAEAAAMVAQMSAQMQLKAKVAPTEERRKIATWEARRYDVKLTSALGMEVEVTVWASEGIPVDLGLYREIADGIASVEMGTAEMVRELGKIPGVPVLEETRTTMMGNTVTSRDELLSVEKKDGEAAGYEVPAGFRRVPFNPFAPPEAPPSPSPSAGPKPPASGK